MAFWTAAAIGGAALLGSATSIIGGNKAASAQEKGAQMATDEQRRQYDQTRADFTPYRTSGYGALNRLRDITLGSASGGPDYSAFYKSPSYDFQRTEGTRGIERSATARSGALSGNVLRDLTKFSSNLAATGFNDYYNRVKGIADMGLGATGSTAAAGSNAANNISNNYLQSADARASGYLGTANTIGGALDTGLNNYLMYKGGYFDKPPRTVNAYGLPSGALG